MTPLFGVDVPLNCDTTTTTNANAAKTLDLFYFMWLRETLYNNAKDSPFMPCFTCTYSFGKAYIYMYFTYLPPANAPVRQRLPLVLLLQLWQSLYPNTSAAKAVDVFYLHGFGECCTINQCRQNFRLVLLVLL